MSSPRTLVTGATGMIGSALVRRLVSSGESIAVLCRKSSTTDLLSDVANDVDFRFGDVTELETVDEAMAGIDVVYHVAGHIGFGGRGTAARLKAVNVQGTANVVDVALKSGIGRLVLTSSMAALGKPHDPTELIDEHTEGRPSSANSRYAVSKYRSELEVQRGIAEGLDAVIVNPSLVFGEGRSGENTWRLVEAIARSKIPGYPPGGTNVVDVRDVVDGHVAALERGVCGERYFLGSENLSWQEIMATLARALEVRPPELRMPPGLVVAGGHIMQTWARLTGSEPRITAETAKLSLTGRTYSNEKARRELGLTFRPFEVTANRVAAAFRRMHLR